MSTMGADAKLAIEDSSIRLPCYLLSLAGQNNVGLNLASVLEKETEQGNGGDTDIEGNGAWGHEGRSDE